jgi:hypothetical protein
VALVFFRSHHHRSSMVLYFSGCIIATHISKHLVNCVHHWLWTNPRMEGIHTATLINTPDCVIQIIKSWSFEKYPRVIWKFIAYS